MSRERPLTTADLEQLESNHAGRIEPKSIPVYQVGRDEKTGKPILPSSPERGDRPGQLGWLTAVLACSRSHPVIDVRAYGNGEDGVIEFMRLDAPTITYDPAIKLADAARMAKTLAFALQDFDGDPYSFGNAQARDLDRLGRRAATVAEQVTVTHEALMIVTTLLHTGEERPVSTRGLSSGERAQRVVDLKPRYDELEHAQRFSYLRDPASGELMMRVSDVRRVARQVQEVVRHGWLDAAMEAAGFERLTLQGYWLDDGGRRGKHEGVQVYRGSLPTPEEDVQ